MADHRLLGLPAVWALGTTAQAARRLTPEWRSMSKGERRDEILGHVEDAKNSGIGDLDAQAKGIAELFLVGRPSEWPYWVAKSQEDWFAWHVVHSIVRRLWQEDRDRVAEPPLSDWVSGFFDNPEPPSRGRGQPKGGQAFLHKVAVKGVYALVDASLCDVIGTEMGDGASACDLVAGRLQMKPRSVYSVWRSHRKDLVTQVAALISPVGELEPSADTVRRACNIVATRKDLSLDTVRQAWRQHQKHL